MKNIKRLIILFFFLFPLSGNTTNISQAEIPNAVIAGLKVEHSDAKNINVTRQTHFGLTLYEVQFDLHGKPHEALFDPTGKPFGHEETVKKLPKVVNYSLKRQLGKFNIVQTVSIQHPDGRKEYEIDLRLNNQLWEVITNENGKILIKEKI